MRLIDGFSHIATVTDDVDRLIAFYRRVFDAQPMFDMTEDGVRHAAIDVGGLPDPDVGAAGGLVIHAFHVPWAERDDRREAFERGRIDHFGLTVPNVDALLEVRRRLLAEGPQVTNGDVRDFGPVYSIHFVDPDGVHLEVNLFKREWGRMPVLPQADWTVVDLEPSAA
jgi:catechol 2,3-dioxygenase-like lactoylglutathione lyase family enzyme